jgi:hypothetical protein
MFEHGTKRHSRQAWGLKTTGIEFALKGTSAGIDTAIQGLKTRSRKNGDLQLHVLLN